MIEEAYDQLNDYLQCFSKEAAIIAEMMRILNEKLDNEDLRFEYPTSKEMFDMVVELTYSADRRFKKEKGIDDTFRFTVDPFFSKEDALSEMRTLLREELQRYFDAQNG